MSVKPADFFKLAALLGRSIQHGDESPEETDPKVREALMRVVAGRVYYAIFNEALDAAKARGYARPKGSKSSHQHLWHDWFKVHEKRDDIATNGKQLLALRIRADYRLNQQFELDIDDILELGLETAKLILAYKDYQTPAST